MQDDQFKMESASGTRMKMPGYWSSDPGKTDQMT